jgi:superoxide dismutase, Cu-Zn family
MADKRVLDCVASMALTSERECAPKPAGQGRRVISAPTTRAAIQTFVLPGDAVFPESIGVDQRTGDAYVGSLADGTVYRLTAGTSVVEEWSPAGAGGRGSVAGVKVDRRGRLWTAGGYDGTLWVYDLDSRERLARFDIAHSPSCVNDIAFGPDDTAYVTDSFLPWLLRVAPGLDGIEPWVDLEAQGVPWPPELNFNGIVVTPDASHVVACQTNLGRYWRISLKSGVVSEVPLDGGPLPHSDGLAIRDETLYAAINAHNRLAVIALEPDGRAGRVTTSITSDAFRFPTAIAVTDTRLLVVNAQLDRMAATPQLPFTVVAVEAAAR